MIDGTITSNEHEVGRPSAVNATTEVTESFVSNAEIPIPPSAWVPAVLSDPDAAAGPSMLPPPPSLPPPPLLMPPPPPLPPLQPSSPPSSPTEPHSDSPNSKAVVSSTKKSRPPYKYDPSKITLRFLFANRDGLTVTVECNPRDTVGEVKGALLSVWPEGELFLFCFWFQVDSAIRHSNNKRYPLRGLGVVSLSCRQ